MANKGASEYPRTYVDLTYVICYLQNFMQFSQKLKLAALKNNTLNGIL